MDENKDEVILYNDVNFCEKEDSKVSSNRVCLDLKISTDGSNAIKNDIYGNKYYLSNSVDVYSELNEAFFSDEYIEKEVSDNKKYTFEEYLTNEYESEDYRLDKYETEEYETEKYEFEDYKIEEYEPNRYGSEEYVSNEYGSKEYEQKEYRSEKSDYNSDSESLNSKSLKNRSSKDNKIVDLEYIRAAKNGDLYAMNYIFNKYKPIIFQKSSVYFLKGSDKEDIIQEGLIGLYYAVKNYDENVGVSFGSFAKLCISRQMINAVRSSTSQKHQPLNNYLSISPPGNNEDIPALEIENRYPQDNPEKIVLSMESVEQIIEFINNELTTLEEQVLNLFLLGDSYEEIARKLGKNSKSIDNAVQRTRKKLEKLLK